MIRIPDSPPFVKGFFQKNPGVISWQATHPIFSKKIRGILSWPVYNRAKGGDTVDHWELIAALRQRQSGALEEFHRRFAPLLRYIIAPILPDERDREECLSDIQLQVWDAIESYDPDRASLTTWLTHLARNAALNRRRGNSRRGEDGCLDETVPDAGDTPEQSAIRRETTKALWDAVGRLGRRDRELFLRKYYYYQSTAQISSELGLTDRAVEGRLYRIRKRLQEELGGECHG
jgi:RNA polymerase sigma-70 factor (ECF subfamily)